MTETSRKTKTGMGTKTMKTTQIGTNPEKLEMGQKGDRTGRTGNDTEVKWRWKWLSLSDKRSRATTSQVLRVNWRAGVNNLYFGNRYCHHVGDVPFFCWDLSFLCFLIFLARMWPEDVIVNAVKRKILMRYESFIPTSWVWVAISFKVCQSVSPWGIGNTWRNLDFFKIYKGIQKPLRWPSSVQI